MTKIIVEIHDSLLLRVLMESGEQHVSLDAFLNQALEAALESPNPVPPQLPVDIADLITSALHRVAAIEIGKEFFLSDVLTDAAWQTLTGGERKSFGKLFRKAVESNTPPIAKWVRRASNNLAVYLRV